MGEGAKDTNTASLDVIGCGFVDRRKLHVGFDASYHH
jgi:hypothetical protein